MQFELMPIGLLVWNEETLPKYYDDHAAILGNRKGLAFIA